MRSEDLIPAVCDRIGFLAALLKVKFQSGTDNWQEAYELAERITDLGYEVRMAVEPHLSKKQTEADEEIPF